MKKLAITLLFVLGFVTTIVAQGFIEHTVKEGESMASIVRKYEVSPYELYELNPDAQEGIQPGTVLVFLRNKNYPYDPTLVNLKRYKVGKRETLKEIAFNNSVTEADIKKYNPKLYSESPKKGDRIKIPVFDESLAVIENTTSAISEPKEIQHVVKTKETKYGIAHQYQITIDELEELNPHIKEGLKVGQLLTIKSVKEENIEATTAKETDSKFAFYEVQPKEGFYRLEKKLGISKDSLMTLNPQLADGIKLGMILKYPKSEVLFSDRLSVSLIDSLSTIKPQKITLLMPFMLDRVVETDSTSNLKKELVKENNTLNKSLDFYTGAVMALDSLKQLGINSTLRVFDTEYSKDLEANKKRITAIIDNDFEEGEIVMGPLVSSNVVLAAQMLKDKNIPVIAPYAIKAKDGSENLYQTETSIGIQRDLMISYLMTYSKDKNIIIVADEGTKDIKDILMSKFPNAKLVKPREGGLMIPKDFMNILKEDTENVVIVEASNRNTVATSISILDTFLKKHTISLFTTSSKKWFDGRGVANRYKSKLNFHFPSSTKEVVFESEDAFSEKYEREYGKLPNKYVLRGFDLTMDVVLRNQVANNFEEGVLLFGETKYFESKFSYTKSSIGGYKNTAVYILRYTPEFTLVEADKEVVEEIINTEE